MLFSESLSSSGCLFAAVGNLFPWIERLVGTAIQINFLTNEIRLPWSLFDWLATWNISVNFFYKELHARSLVAPLKKRCFTNFHVKIFVNLECTRCHMYSIVCVLVVLAELNNRLYSWELYSRKTSIFLVNHSKKKTRKNWLFFIKSFKF